MRNKISLNLHTIGCRLNQSETASLHAQLSKDTLFTIVPDDQPADVTVINTCTVTAKGDTDTRKIIARMRRLNPNVRIALIGCQAQTQKEQLLKLPNVQWVIGNDQKAKTPDIIKETIGNDFPLVISPEIERKEFLIPVTGSFPNHTRANIKIQDGCDFFCSYCEVPYARGRSRSRNFQDILREAKELTLMGHKELVLTGVNVGTYKSDNYGLADLISALNDIKGLMRLRLSSIEPNTFDKQILQYMIPNGKLCRFLHIPLQNADDQILKAMNRKHSYNDFADLVMTIKKTIPEICIGTDIIVGFPNETKTHFMTAYKRLTDLPLSYFHVFSYSPRPNAKSCRLKDNVTPKAKAERSKTLRELSVLKRKAFYQGFLQTKQTVLFEERKEGIWSGLTDHYIRVRLRSEENLHNQLKDIHIKKAEQGFLWGKFSS